MKTAIRPLSLLTAALATAIFSSMPASAAVFNYSVTLNGPSEIPVNASPGTGLGTVSYDNVSHLLSLNVSFSGLLGNTTASHIHAPTASPFSGTAGVATTTPTFAGFPLGVTGGAYLNVLDLTQASSYNPSYVTANGGTTAGAEAALTAAMAAGKSYWNIHSTSFPGGEIRGFLVAVPEPASAALIVLGAVCMGIHAKRKNRRL